jgi:hypothetical protein
MNQTKSKNKVRIKGISSAVATIIIATISITLVGTTYFFSQGLLKGATAETFEIIDVFSNMIIVRNLGTQPIENFTVLVDGNKINNGIKEPPVEPGKVGTVVLNLTDVPAGRHELVIISKSMSQRWTWEFQYIAETTTVTTTPIPGTTPTTIGVGGESIESVSKIEQGPADIGKIKGGVDRKIKCSRGSCETTYYFGRRFYFENNNWNEIDTTFQTGNATWDWKVEKNNFKVYVKNNKIKITGEENSKIDFELPSNSVPTVKDNILSYDFSKYFKQEEKDYFVNATINIIIHPEYVEKLITIYNLSLPYDFDYSETVDLKENRFKIGDLSIWSCNWIDDVCIKNYYPANWVYEGNRIKFTISKTWLDSANYPIYIDPTVYYNYSDTTNNKAYGRSMDSGTVTTTLQASETLSWTTGWGGYDFKPGGYTNLQLSDNWYSNLTSGTSNQEPYGRFNFTINENIGDINWINVTMEQNTLGGGGSGEACYYYIANFTNTNWFQFGASITTANSADMVRSMNFTSSTDISKIIDSNKQLVLLSWGTDLDSGEGCRVDYVEVRVGYSSKITFSNPFTNNMNAKPNDLVNFTITVTTNDPSLSGYIFSNNFTGSWQNSSWIAFPSTKTATAWNISTATSPGKYAWKVYANSSLNVWGVSEEQIFNFSIKTLLVNWTVGSQINSTTCTEGSPCQYQQYQQFTANATVNCNTNPPGLSCGSITSGIRYNDTGNVMKLINTIETTPMYVLGGKDEYYDQYIYSWWNFSTANQGITNPSGVAYNRTYFWVINRSSSPKILRYFANGTYDNTWSKDCSAEDSYLEGLYVNKTHIFVAGTGNDRIYIYDIETGTYITSFLVSGQTGLPTSVVFNGTYFWVLSSELSNKKVYRYRANGDYTPDSWNFDYSIGVGSGVLGNGLEFNGTHFFISDISTGKVFAYDSTGNYVYWNFSVSSQPRGLDWEESEKAFYTVDYSDKYVRRYIRNSTIVSANPIPLGLLNDGGTKQVNFTVNLTNSSGTYKIDVNFTSSLTNNNPPENHTNDAIIKILTPSYTWLYLNWTEGDRRYNKSEVAYIYANCSGCIDGNSIKLYSNYTGTISQMNTIRDTGKNNAYNYTYTSNLDLGPYLINATTSDYQHTLSYKNYTLTVVDEMPPRYSDNSTDSTTAGKPIKFSVKWTDNFALSGYTLSLDNCTGSFNNESWSNSGWESYPSTGWSNVTRVINSTPNCTVRWRYFANDTSNNWNVSQNFSFVTTGVTPSYTWLYLNWTEGDRRYNKSEVAYIYANCSGCIDGNSIKLYSNYTGTISQMNTIRDTGKNNAYNYTYTSNLDLGPYLINATTSDYQHTLSYKNYTLTVVDEMPPRYSDNSTDSTTAGKPIKFSVKWTDNDRLSGYIFSLCNGTWDGTSCLASWVDEGWTSFTGICPNPYSECWSNVTKVVNSTAGSTIKWKVYVNDTSKNGNVSENIFNTTPQKTINIWNLAVRRSTDGQPITESRTGINVIISVNVSGDISYVQGNFTWPNGTIVLQNLTLNETANYNYNWTYYISLSMPCSEQFCNYPNASINVTAYDIYGYSNSTNTTLIILETVELTVYGPVNFSMVNPGSQVSAIEYHGWPLKVYVAGNTPINLSQNASSYLSGKINPNQKIKIENITWNTSNSTQAIFTNLTTSYKFINKTDQFSNQSIYYKLFVPPVEPQDYGGDIYICGMTRKKCGE